MEFKAQNITKDILLNCMYIVVAVYSRDTKNVVATTRTRTATDNNRYLLSYFSFKKSQYSNKKATKSQQKYSQICSLLLEFKLDIYLPNPALVITTGTTILQHQSVDYLKPTVEV